MQDLDFYGLTRSPLRCSWGDAGALSIGAVLGTVSIITKQEFVLAIVGGVFVAETLSVIAQVAYFKGQVGKDCLRGLLYIIILNFWEFRSLK